MFLKNEQITQGSLILYLPILVIILLSSALVLFIDITFFKKVQYVNYSNLILEFILSFFALAPLFSIQKYKTEIFYKNLNIGFYLLFLSFYVDTLDQIFAHSILFTLTCEKATLIVASIYLFVGSKQWMKDFETISLTDDLTNIPNRRLSREIISQEILYCRKHELPLCLVVLDIDYFKKINDQFGHNTGDKVLKSFAKLLSKKVRNQDNVGRWGGEEFLILLKGENLDQSIKTMNRLRLEIARFNFGDDKLPLKLSVSIGISQMDLDDDFESLFIKADKQLFIGKNSGRNSVRPKLIIN